MDRKDDVLVLIDEEGAEEQYELLDSFELNDAEYVVLLPFAGYEDGEIEYADDDDEMEDEEVIILKKEHSRNGEDVFVTVEDEEELDTVFEEFNQRMEENLDYENED